MLLGKILLEIDQLQDKFTPLGELSISFLQKELYGSLTIQMGERITDTNNVIKGGKFVNSKHIALLYVNALFSSFGNQSLTEVDSGNFVSL